MRPTTPPHTLSGKAFILNQLKHPDEVIWLRHIYGNAFHLVGVFCPEDVRFQYLHVARSIPEEDAKKLIARDKGEEFRYGQQVTETFQHADVFVDLQGYDAVSVEDARSQLQRYLDLLFGHKTISPTREEYGMFLAQSSALRTADLSRQVGASILTTAGEVVSVGTNEVPAPGGGQYWHGPNAVRDIELQKDENTKIKFENLEEVIAALTDDWDSKSDRVKKRILDSAAKKLDSTRWMNLTEFSRAVHAEMDAVLAAGRIGVSVRGCELYCTTFPCHNCCKHIVNAGISRVQYIEPYPKSLAERLHSDAILLGTRDTGDSRVAFEPFRGIAPRMYGTLFSTMTPVGKRIKRKNDLGDADLTPAGLRVKSSPWSYIEREALAVDVIMSVVPPRNDVV